MIVVRAVFLTGVVLGVWLAITVGVPLLLGWM